MAEIKCDFGDIPHGGGKHRKIIEDMVKKFIGDTDLFKIKPDMRVIIPRDSWKNDNDQNIALITIPDDMEVPPPYTKYQYPGGLYAATTDPDLDLMQWVQDSENYEWEVCSKGNLRLYGWEYFNPFNIYGLSDFDYENDWQCSYTTELLPIREFKKWSDDDKKRINSELDAIIARGEPLEIDLTSMILEKKDKSGAICELNYSNGLMELKYNDGIGAFGSMLTPRQFNAPIKIELRVKTDKGEDFIFGCGELFVCLNYLGKDWLNISDGTDGRWEWEVYKKCGAMPADEFVDIELFLGKENLAIRANGDIRHYSGDYGYIEALKKHPEYSLGAVYVGTAGGSTVTVQSLRVTEI
jgi:hypothetical protein